MTDNTEHAGRDRSLVAEYVLGVLSHADQERVGREIEANPGLRAEHAFWAAHFSALDDEFAPVAAPRHVYVSIERRLFGVDAPKLSFWNNVALWRTLTAGALAIAVLAVGFATLRPDVAQPTAEGQQLVAMLEEIDSDVRMVALYDGTGQLRVTTLAGRPAADRDYELWVIEGGNAPKSMGIVSADAPTVVVLPESEYAGWNADALLAITLEPLGGGPGGIPTGPVVAKGTLTRI
jgi:anti-sigma-K factor RskA